MNNKDISYWMLVALCMSFSGPIYAQQTTNSTYTNVNDYCLNPQKRASRDSTCINGSTVAIAKNVGASEMGVAKGKSYITLNLTNSFCTTPWGTIIDDGQVVSAYLALDSTDCKVEVRSCINGTLSGTYRYPLCNVAPSSPPMPPPSTNPTVTGCEWIISTTPAPLGTVAPTCDITGPGPFPKGQKYTCGDGYTWVMTSVGDSDITEACR